MNWQQYSVAMLVFSAISLLMTYLVERAQAWLPWNPQHLAGVAPAIAFNTAASFTTNTNWQSYTPETTMGYLTQMAGLATHNFFSAAPLGIVVAVALLIRGIPREQPRAPIGNFWSTRRAPSCTCCCPDRLIYALLLVAQGVPQTRAPYTTAHHAGAAVTQSSRRARSLRRKSSRSWARTAAVSSTPTARIRSRIPRRFTNFLEMFSIFAHPCRAHLHAGPHDRLAAAWLGGVGARWRFCFWPA